MHDKASGDPSAGRSTFDVVVRPALEAALVAIDEADGCYDDRYRYRYGTVAWLKGCIESALA